MGFIRPLSWTTNVAKFAACSFETELAIIMESIFSFEIFIL